MALKQYEYNSSRKRINEEAGSGTWHTIDLPLNHFDVLDNRTYRARYITNDQFYKKGGPLIVYIGGEWTIEPYGVLGGVAFQLAREHHGYLFYPEHRYFGESLPFPKPVSTENLKYITPDFSLADLAFTISHVKETVDGLKDSQVVAIGGSYAGALAVWGRMKYPHVIDMAYACGGVVNSDMFNSNYYEVNYRSLKQVSGECADIINTGVLKAQDMMKTKEGRVKLTEMFPLFVCPGIKKRFNIAQEILNSFNAQIWPVYKTRQVCNYLLTKTKGSPLERLAQTAPFSANPDEDRNNCIEHDKEWHFLVCTFVGNIQITSESNFGNIYPPELQLRDICTDILGSNFTTGFVDKHTHRSTILYGGTSPDVTKILSLQGTHDPWYPNAIIDDLNDETPVIYIEDANHCLEIGEEQDDETPQVAQSKIEILKQLAKWIR